jgi:hypothetical protein
LHANDANALQQLGEHARIRLDGAPFVRTTHRSAMSDVVVDFESGFVFGRTSRAKLAREFAGIRRPFPSLRHSAAVRRAAAARAHGELLALEATYKETDLFKLYQTADFANYATPPPCARCWRCATRCIRTKCAQFVEHVTQCGALSDRVDCAANVYMRGSHLLAHDDVIGTRRVSYIIYLSEPDEPWTQLTTAVRSSSTRSTRLARPPRRPANDACCRYGTQWRCSSSSPASRFTRCRRCLRPTSGASAFRAGITPRRRPPTLTSPRFVSSPPPPPSSPTRTSRHLHCRSIVWRDDDDDDDDRQTRMTSVRAV